MVKYGTLYIAEFLYIWLVKFVCSKLLKMYTVAYGYNKIQGKYQVESSNWNLFIFFDKKCMLRRE